ncbi:MAG: sulfotransferase [Gammaproteobacteria bacterium]|nr:sulfotransferase [Gammaproteobacteria bacterium]
MRASLLLESDPAAAAAAASDILAGSPEHGAASLLLATACRKLGDPASAVRVLESLLQARSDAPFLQLELARAYVAAQRNSEALAAFRRATDLAPRLAEGWLGLAAQLHAAGEEAAGDRAYARYLRLSPLPAELNEPIVALRSNRPQAAAALLRQHLQQRPHDVLALRLLADAATMLEDDVEAERRLQECLALAPGYAAARYDLARLLAGYQRIPEMLPHIERLLASDGGNLDYLTLKAQGLRYVGRSTEAMGLMEQIVARHPGEEQAWLVYGDLLREGGTQAAAIAAYRRALELRPGSGLAFTSLANLKTFRFDSGDLTTLQQQLALPATSAEDRIRLEFALGKGLEDVGDFAGSFEHYERGNRLKRATLSYDPQVMTAEVQRSREFYGPSFFAQRAGWGSQRADPIFIIGVPRCGSTLLEQMLASHSQVEGTRELLDLPTVAFGLISAVSAPKPTTFSERLGALGREETEALAASYLERVQEKRLLGKPRFVDKLLGNWCYVGLIHLLFPRASIIDARRHPLACGLSCYQQLFDRGQKFTYDLGELGRFYRDYASLMEHFDMTLPGRVHRVYYERLVADPEGELRRLLDYCGLPYEEQCLRFYESGRIVHTLSSEQVRQPIYTERVDHWRHYEQWLGPLRKPLDILLPLYPRP